MQFCNSFQPSTKLKQENTVPKPITLDPGDACNLDDIASRVETDAWDKQSAYEKIDENCKEMALLARKLYAENQRSLLLVLQAMDAAGKDSTVRCVTKGVNPRSFQVYSFKKPSEREQDYDYLWRIHREVPRKGNVGIFNRSHYEDVLVVRVHHLVPEEVWTKRYEQINHFEKLLAETGTTIVKCYLHISKDEQRERLQARMDDPDAHWKVNLGDLEERKLWRDYRKAYNDAITKCNTAWAPWYIVPADRQVVPKSGDQRTVVGQAVRNGSPLPQGRTRLSGNRGGITDAPRSPGVKKRLADRKERCRTGFRC